MSFFSTSRCLRCEETLKEIGEVLDGWDSENLELEIDALVDEGLLSSSGGVLTTARYELTDDGADAWSIARASPRIFVVHGHDHRLLRQVEKLIENDFADELKVIVLQDQPSRGNESLLDKFERHAPRDGDLAVVLMTADDLGRAKGSGPGKLRPRARKNAVLELGYCISSVGRERTWVLLDEGVEKPSDIEGGTWISTAKAWKQKLRRDLRATLDGE